MKKILTLSLLLILVIISGCEKEEIEKEDLNQIEVMITNSLPEEIHSVEGIGVPGRGDQPGTPDRIWGSVRVDDVEVIIQQNENEDSVNLILKFSGEKTFSLIETDEPSCVGVVIVLNDENQEYKDDFFLDLGYLSAGETFEEIVVIFEDIPVKDIFITLLGHSFL